MDKYGIIYCAYNIKNNKRYIGQTIRSLSERKSNHYSHGKNGCPYFYHALHKYDKQDWIWKIIDIGHSKEDLDNKERFWIAFFQSQNSKYGYNISDCGSSGKPTLENIRKARDRFREIYGVEREAKITLKNVLRVETGERFKTCKAAGKAKSTSYSHISEAANGKLKTAGGYHWQWCIDYSLFSNALYCKELNKYYTSLNETKTQDGFNSTALSRALKIKGSPCCYAGYTFSWVNPDLH